MSKKVKMVLYAPPGVGKSTFASKTPNPLFLSTDGNFEWLGLPEKNHVRLSSWDQAKKVFADILAGKYPEFDTIVVDLIEDLYVWAEREFCESKKIEHIGDYKSMGAGYSVVRKEFFAEVSKLISCDKHVLLLSHEVTLMEKNRVGAETYKHYPSNKISIDKQWDDIEGQVRYFLRAYIKPEELDGKIIKKRYLSIVPKENEYGIARGLDEANAPEDIILDWNVFAEVIGLNDTNEPKTTPVVKPTPATPKVEPKVITPKVEPKVAPKVAPTPIVEKVISTPVPPTPVVEKVVEVVAEPAPQKVEEPIVEHVPEDEEIPVPVHHEEAPAEEVKPTEPVVEAKPMSQADKIAAIKAKLAAMKK